MIRSIAKKGLDSIGMLDSALKLKRKYLPIEETFRSCTPPLLIAVNKALMHLKANGGPKGDYLEFGVFRGFTLWYTQQIAESIGLSDMRYFGFDTFKGIPELKDEEKKWGTEFSQGQFEASKEYVESMLKKYGSNFSKVHLVEGVFEQSLTPALREKEKLKTCSLAVIDSDLYSSAKDALNFLVPLIATGTIILFDDWNSYERDDNRGERRAFREILSENKNLSAAPFGEFGDHGAGFIMRRD